MRINFKRREWHLRVDICRPRAGDFIIPDTGDSDLAGARAVTLCGFDMQCDELEIPIRQR
ncbi:hypothetical protein [Granulosicoccus antarcticus]|uniref:hypothetical protein n=1 Tax=Granulosicoccus antarcticus TaxID=437505 RepID=UPI0012FDB0B6|nr:hypothetical protein [Granulosicoccus antarcticus]